LRKFRVDDDTLSSAAVVQLPVAACAHTSVCDIVANADESC